MSMHEIEICRLVPARFARGLDTHRRPLESYKHAIIKTIIRRAVRVLKCLLDDNSILSSDGAAPGMSRIIRHGT